MPIGIHFDDDYDPYDVDKLPPIGGLHGDDMDDTCMDDWDSLPPIGGFHGDENGWLMEVYMETVKCKNCKHFDGKMKCTLFCEEVYPDYTRKCSEFQPAMTKCGDCIHYANSDCPVGNGNTTADHICECVFFNLSASGSKMVSDNVNSPARKAPGEPEYAACMDCDNYSHDGRHCNLHPETGFIGAACPACDKFVAKRKYDAVNHPNHYTQGGIECIEAIKAATVGLEGIEAVCTANAIKYLWRWKHKNGAEDINKAIWYLERLKQEVQEDATTQNPETSY